MECVALIRRFQALFFVLVSWMLFSAPLAAAQNGGYVSKIPQMMQLAHKAADQGTVRVIVELEVPNIEVAAARSAQIKAGLAGPVKQWRAAAADAALKSHIAGTAEELLIALAPTGARALRRYDVFPLVAIDVSADALEELSRSSLVRHVAEDRLSKPLLGDTVDIIGASAAWDSGYTGAGWSVAILDTGILSSHEFFTDKTIVEACFSASGDCPNGETAMTGAGAAVHYSSAYTGYDHGTHVAGIAAGKKSDGTLAGVAKDASIIAVQVFSRFDNSEYCLPEEDCILSWDSDQIKALDYVYSLRTTTNIAAVNLSLGGGAYSSICDEDAAVYKLAVDQLRDVGIATIAASGNESQCNAISSPACISSVISVGAADDTDEMTYFSNYRGDMLDLFAPGLNIESSVATSDTAYESWAGTSMATPHVTGVFALLRQKDSAASVEYLLDTLVETGAPVTGSVDCETGGEILPIPRVQVDEAMDRLEMVPAAPDELVATLIGLDQIQLTWMDNATDESGFMIERSTGDDSNYTQIAVVGADMTNYSDSALSDGTTYVYRVRAYNDYGQSDYCPEADATIPLAVPENLSGTAVSATRIDLVWSDNSMVESGFEIERSLNGIDSFSLIATLDTDVEDYSDTSVTAGRTYYYRIRSTSLSLASTYSDSAQVTTPEISSVSGDESSGDAEGGGGCFISLTASD